MPLLQLRDVRLSFGGPPLLDGVDLQIESGERLCLVGRNGAGKSTLLKLICDEIEAEEGEVSRRQGLVVARLEQEVPRGAEGTVFDIAAAGLGRVGELIVAYQKLVLALADGASEQDLLALERVQSQLESENGWDLSHRVETVLSRLKLDPQRAFSDLSGGLKRRVLLARALIREPDLLLLDEPTNHLDVESILWLEEFLHEYGQALLFITHDRVFARNLATRVIELDRGRLINWRCTYDEFIERRADAETIEARERALFDKRLAQEETWIRQGIKARRTRNEGRVRALERLRDEHRARRSSDGRAKFSLNQSDTSGKRVIEAQGISFRYEDLDVVRDFSTCILRGDKVGLIGPNGVGKTTVLKLLLGELQPQQGTVEQGSRLEIAYFDQHRSLLDENKSVLDNLAGGSDTVTVNGQSKHVMSYLQDFLFTPERVRTPVRALSGGERNRLVLARLFARPSNLLVMDEPTNDLDMETLELLEDLLLEYTGTLLLVSHDRAFLNNVVTSCLAFEGDAQVNDYVGGYDDWLRQRDAAVVAVKPASKPTQGAQKSTRAVKLGYKDQRELEGLPARIEALETEQAQLHMTMAQPTFFQQDEQTISAAQSRLTAVDAELAQSYQRWESLESLAGGAVS